MNRNLLYALLGGSIGAYVALKAVHAQPDTPAAAAANPTPPVAEPNAAPRLLAGLGKLLQVVAQQRPQASVPQLTTDASVALTDAVQAYAPDEVNALWTLRRLTAIIAQEPAAFRSLLLQKYWQTLDTDH